METPNRKIHLNKVSKAMDSVSIATGKVLVTTNTLDQLTESWSYDAAICSDPVLV